MQKPAVTEHEIHNLLKERWSPRAFDNKAVETDKLLSLFEAARWSPSGGNSQPWSFIIITQEQAETHEKLIEALTGRNPIWAKNAPVLIVAVAKLNLENPAFSRYAYYDLGQAMAHLTIQAAHVGLHVHQMAGFAGQKIRELFEIPEGYDVVTVSAVGYFGTPEQLPDGMREQELAARIRKPLTDFVFGEYWGQSLPALTSELVEAGVSETK